MIQIERRHFGVLVPSTNTTVEIEYTNYLPATLQFHAARLGKGSAGPFSPSKDEDVIYQSKMLGDARVEVVAIAQTSASLFDDGYDAKVKGYMSQNAGVPGITSAEAIGEAIQALRMKRIGIITPYSTQVIESAKRYYERKYGLQVLGMESLGATDSYAIAKFDANVAFEGMRRVNRPDIELLIVPGGNFPTLPWIAEWERVLGKPVITTNQAALWGVLGVMKLNYPLPGLGRLLEQMPR
jgi:maleate cis-trans isomerase